MILLPFRESRALKSVSVFVCLIRVFSSARKVFDCLFCCLFCFYLLVFFFFRCFRREARWVFEVSLFPQGTLCRQLNHSPDYKTNHSTSPDARHVILRKQLSYSYVLDN